MLQTDSHEGPTGRSNSKIEYNHNLSEIQNVYRQTPTSTHSAAPHYAAWGTRIESCARYSATTTTPKTSISQAHSANFPSRREFCYHLLQVGHQEQEVPLASGQPPRRLQCFLLPLLDFALRAGCDEQPPARFVLHYEIHRNLGILLGVEKPLLPFQLLCYFIGSQVDLLIVSMHSITSKVPGWPHSTIYARLFCAT